MQTARQRLVKFTLLPPLSWSCSEFRILTDLNAFSSAAVLHDPPVTFSSAIALTPFSRSSTRGGNFLTNMSLNPPTQTPTACGDRQKRKKKSGFYTNLRKCFEASSHTCDLWNATRLCSIVIKMPEVSGRAEHKGALLFSQARVSLIRMHIFSWFGWQQWDSDSAVRNHI